MDSKYLYQMTSNFAFALPNGSPTFVTAAESNLQGVPPYIDLSQTLGNFGESVSVRVSGTDGPVAVLVHGNSSSVRCWDKQFESKLSSCFKLVAVDLPGHGLSGVSKDPKQSYSLPGMAEYLIKLLAAIEIKEAVYVGWSLGGHILLEALDRLPQPLGVMLVGCPPTNDALEGFMHIPSAAMQSSPTEKDLSSHLLSLVTCVEGRAEFEQDFARTDPLFRPHLFASIKQGNFKDEVSIARESSTSIAIVHGGLDPNVDLTYLQKLSIPQLWRQGVQVVPQALHAVQYDAPDLFNSILADFVSEMYFLAETQSKGPL